VPKKHSIISYSSQISYVEGKMLKKKIQQIIVVEGKNDYNAVSRAVDAHIIITSGFGLNAQILSEIKTAQEKNGVIVLTDPDFMGEKIRSIIEKKIPGVLHAYISRRDGTVNKDIGVENASPEVILSAIKKAISREEKYGETENDNFIEYTSIDLYNFGLSGSSNSESLRADTAAKLGLGNCNSKQFLTRLNKYKISRSEFIKEISHNE